MGDYSYFPHERPTTPLWVRGIFELPNGRRITRTVRWNGTIAAEDEEGKAVAAYELIEELEHAGHDFPEGHGLMVELLGVATG